MLNKIFNCDAIPSNRIAAMYNQKELEAYEAEERIDMIPKQIFRPKDQSKVPVLTIMNAEGQSIFSIERDAAL